MLRQFPPARGAVSAGSLRQVSATRGMRGSGPSFGGEGCGSRTRCWLGPNEGAPEGEERKGSPGGRPSTPEPPGLIGFVSGPARSCQLSPGRGAGGRGGARCWELRLPCSNFSLPLLGTKLLFWVFSLEMEIWGNFFLAVERSYRRGALVRWGSPLCLG